MTVWHMRIACWIPKATNTYSDYVILTAFPHERVSMLCFTCTDCLVLEWHSNFVITLGLETESDLG